MASSITPITSDTEVHIGEETSQAESSQKLIFHADKLLSTWIYFDEIVVDVAGADQTETKALMDRVVPDLRTMTLTQQFTGNGMVDSVLTNHGSVLGLLRQFNGVQDFFLRANQVPEQGGVIRIIVYPRRWNTLEIPSRRQFNYDWDLSKNKECMLSFGFNNLHAGLIIRRQTTTSKQKWWPVEEDFSTVNFALFWHIPPRTMQFSPEKFVIDINTRFREVQMIGYGGHAVSHTNLPTTNLQRPHYYAGKPVWPVNNPIPQTETDK